MATGLQANTVQWGSIVFSPDNEEEPQRATKLSAGELLHQIAVPDARTGHYRFGEEAIEYL